MTHFQQLPVRTGPSPMEDAIVQQVEWYMGRLNLERDEYLKHQMDEQLWVSLDVILNFPKMLRMGVTDKRRVATLLHARSTVVEVDEKTARIRPAWARRSTIVIDCPLNTRLDQVTALFHIPTTADLSNNHPPTSHPHGLISIQPASDTVWLAIFDSPTGAAESLPLLSHKKINNTPVTAEVHVETLRPGPEGHVETLRPGPYSQPEFRAQPIITPPPLINSLPVPMPVIHPEIHMQYPYPHYVQYPPTVVPRLFDRPVAAYLMPYPQPAYEQREEEDFQEEKSLDAQYIHSASIAAEQAYTRRPREQRPRQESVRLRHGGLVDSRLNRKAKKASRTSARHVDRTERKEDDRRQYVEKHVKPEPNLANMHFPPLPISEGGRPGKAVKKLEEKLIAPVVAGKEQHAPVKKEVQLVTVVKPEPELVVLPPLAPVRAQKVQPPNGQVVKPFPVQLTSPVPTPPKPSSPVPVAATTTTAKADRKPAPEKPAAPPQQQPAPMSYAAILRSKKPTPPRPPPAPAPEPSPKAPEPTPEPHHQGKEKSRRRKSHANRHAQHDNKDVSPATTNGRMEKRVDKRSGSGNVTSSMEREKGENKKPVVENTRAHPVWVNKPKSLFQAASVRPPQPQPPIESKKVSSPVSSQGDEKEVEKMGKDVFLRAGSVGPSDVGSAVSKDYSDDGNVNGQEMKVKEMQEEKIAALPSAASQPYNKNKNKSKAQDKNAAANVPPKGAWASGGPKAWPKSAGNGVMEKAAHVTES